MPNRLACENSFLQTLEQLGWKYRDNNRLHREHWCVSASCLYRYVSYFTNFPRRMIALDFSGPILGERCYMVRESQLPRDHTLKGIALAVGFNNYLAALAMAKTISRKTI